MFLLNAYFLGCVLYIELGALEKITMAQLRRKEKKEKAKQKEKEQELEDKENINSLVKMLKDEKQSEIDDKEKIIEFRNCLDEYEKLVCDGQDSDLGKQQFKELKKLSFTHPKAIVSEWNRLKYTFETEEEIFIKILDLAEIL